MKKIGKVLAALLAILVCLSGACEATASTGRTGWQNTGEYLTDRENMGEDPAKEADKENTGEEPAKEADRENTGEDPAKQDLNRGEILQEQNTAADEGDRIEEETEELLSELGLSKMDAYLQQEDIMQMTFSELVTDLLHNGLTLDFSSIGAAIRERILKDYKENRSVLIQILLLAIAFSILLQMTPATQKGYIANVGFLGVYLLLMLLLLRLFLLMTGIVENYLNKLVDFMQMLQPVFCMSMVFSTGSMSAGVYYEMLLLIIYLVDIIFAKVLLPVVQIYMVLQLVNHMMEEARFARIATLLENSVHGCVKILTTAMMGLNIVQGILAPGIDGLKRSTFAGAVRIVPGFGQIMNSTTEILAGSAMLIKNSVGVAAMLILVAISFLPLIKLAVFTFLYQGCAALLEPVSDKRICAATAALGKSASLYLKLMFYALLLFFLTIAIICTITTVSMAF